MKFLVFWERLEQEKKRNRQKAQVQIKSANHYPLKKPNKKPQHPHNPKQQKQTNTMSCHLSGWLFQIAIAVCPTLCGHVKHKTHSWKGEMGEICIGKLGLSDWKNIIVIVVSLSVRVLVKHWIVYSVEWVERMQRSVVNKQITLRYITFEGRFSLYFAVCKLII